MMKKQLFSTLTFLILIKYLCIFTLVVLTYFLDSEVMAKIASVTSGTIYTLSMKGFSLMCGIVLIILSRKSSLRLLWFVGALQAGDAWLLLYWGMEYYHLYRLKDTKVPVTLQIIAVSCVAFALLVGMNHALLLDKWCMMGYSVSLIFIRIFIAYCCYKFLQNRRLLFAITYLLLGEISLLLGEGIAILRKSDDK